MRPLKGRPARGRQRIIMTRVPKQQEPPEVNEDEHKKMTGPLKKRPIITKKVAVTPMKKNEDIEIASMKPRGTVAMNRARRTPKPNPKYSNDNVISLNIRGSSKRGKSDFSDSDDDDLLRDDDDQSVDSAMMDEIRDEESSDNPLDEDPLPIKAPVPIKRRAGRPPKINRDVLAVSLKDERKISPANKMKQTGKPLEAFKRMLARHRRNSDIFDANESDNSISVVPSESIQRAQSKTTTKRVSDGSSSKIQSQRSEGKSSESVKAKKNYSDDEMTTGAASTIDDFETMPTFTIVNIHDIINKKRDVLIAKSPSWQEKPSGRKGNNDDSSKDKYEDAQQERESKDTSPQLARNRRKSLHTTILSDKIDPSKLTTSTPKPSSLPIRKTTTAPPIENDSKKSNESEKQLIQMNYKSYKAAPRILNSYIAKKTKPIPSVIKLETKERKRDFDGNLQSKENFHLNAGSTSNNNNSSTKSNNNLGINTKQLTNNTSSSNSSNIVGSRSASKTISSSNIVTTTTSSTESKSKMGTIAKSIMNNLGNNTATIGNNIQVRKIIPSKDVSPQQQSPQQQQQQQQQQPQQQQSEAKKVLSVETWTIVETPQPIDDYVEPKPVLSFSLIKLGNNVKKIKLPSLSWSYRVALQKVPFDPDAEEFYTGDTPKIKMKDSDNGMLQPVSIMFRRKVHGTQANSQFDRSVTFREPGFNISMNGKCISLAGAPPTIDTLDDIECLLTIVDHLTLKDIFVEELKPTMIV